jgi:hypothetical protein
MRFFEAYRASKVKKQLLQKKVCGSCKKSKFLLRRPSRLSLERLPAGRALLRFSMTL